MASWLRDIQCNQTGRIVDSIHQMPGSYADGFAALTFGLLAWEEPMRQALRVAQTRPVDSEFDQLALALLDRLTGFCVAQPALYEGGALVSNNWALFRALTRQLRGLSFDDRLVECQLISGLFPDCPLGQATPVCYHAKICATLALRARLCEDFSHNERLRRGLEALLWLISPSGSMVPYGRSRHSLFAYGSAYLAMRLGAGLFQEPRFEWAAQQVLSYMRRFQQPDGHIPAVLNLREWLRDDWDVYINNPDYNAYAAACLLLGERLGTSMQPKVPENGLQNLGPLLAWRRAGGYFACSTYGEWVPEGTPFFCDTRYAGLRPLLVEESGGPRFFDRGYCWDGRDSTRSYLVDPRNCPWLPYRRVDLNHYWARYYSDLTAQLKDGILRVSGQGRLAASAPVPSWRRFISGRLLGKPPRQFDTFMMDQSLRVELTYDTISNFIRQKYDDGLWLEEKL